jgi:hypothetical protein
MIIQASFFFFLVRDDKFFKKIFAVFNMVLRACHLDFLYNCVFLFDIFISNVKRTIEIIIVASFIG